MAEGDMAISEEGTDYKTKGAEQKEAEVNGNVGQTEVDMESPSPSESGEEYEKNPRRCRETVYLGIAILLGIALLIVVVYFSALQDLKANKAQLVTPTSSGIGGDSGTTTEMTSTSTETTITSTTDLTTEPSMQPRLRNFPG